MEAELLAGVIQTDTHKRLQIAEQLIEHFKKEDVFDDFPDIESLVGGLSSWVGSSNFKVMLLSVYLTSRGKYSPWMDGVYNPCRFL